MDPNLFVTSLPFTHMATATAAHRFKNFEEMFLLTAFGMKDEPPFSTSELQTPTHHRTGTATRLRFWLLKSVKSGACMDPLAMNADVISLPLVFSIDGMMGQQAISASRQLARKLQQKWNKPYSEICGFIRALMSLSLVRSVSMLLRNPREGMPRRFPPHWETGSGLALH
jgi:hypothetical protein